MGYVNRGEHYQYYRPQDIDAQCDAIPGYPAITTGCARMYSINADGTAATPIYQTSFDTRTRAYYTKAKSTGAPVWSDQYTSAFGNTRLVTFAVPFYNPETTVLRGVSAVSMNLQGCKHDRKY